MYIIGLNLSHDYSACLLKNGEVRVAIALERVARVLRGLVPPSDLIHGLHTIINYCLEAEGIKLQDVDYFIANTTETHDSEAEKKLLSCVVTIPPEKVLFMPHPSHHLAHAYAAFYGSGFPEAAALVVDPYGGIIGQNREAESGFAFSAQQYPKLVFRNLKPLRLPHQIVGERFALVNEFAGIGEIYHIISLILGFRHMKSYYDDAGKTMGLAAYGKPLCKEQVLIRITDAGLDYSNAYAFLASYNLVTEEAGMRYLNLRPASVPLSQFHKDLAAQVQWELEEASLYLASRLRHETGLDNLVLSGGTFLNSITNYRILKEAGFKKLFIFPAATDDGNAIGAAYYGFQVAAEQNRVAFQPKAPVHFYLGRTYPADQTRKAIEAYQLVYQTAANNVEVAEFAAEKLAEGKIIGWHQGGAEFGPRALGNRSILANPLLPAIKDIVNRKVKFRESFRPFAPAVLEEVADEYFALEGHKSPYMLLVCPVRPKYEEAIPGVLHIDGTARVQTVAKAANPLFYPLIEAFGRRTGIPIVLNTSFNLKGMPIVETPQDALHCFMSTELDYLIVDRFIMPMPDFASFVPVRNDLTLVYKACWEGTCKQPTPVAAWITNGVENGLLPRLDSSLTLSVEQRNMLETIDGRKSIRQIAAEFSLTEKQMVPRFLQMYRNGLCHWKHLASVKYNPGLGRLPETLPMPHL